MFSVDARCCSGVEIKVIRRDDEAAGLPDDYYEDGDY